MADASIDKDSMILECQRIEEDTTFSAKGHFNAEETWGRVHLILGVITALTAAWAGLNALKNVTSLSAILAFLAASFAILNTAINPESISNSHGNSARQYKALQNRTRIYRTIELPTLNDEDSVSKFSLLCDERDSLNTSSRGIPNWAYSRARKEIERGAAKHIADTTK